MRGFSGFEPIQTQLRAAFVLAVQQQREEKKTKETNRKIPTVSCVCVCGRGEEVGGDVNSLRRLKEELLVSLIGW